MKFGEFLKNNREEEWKDCYIRYKEADNMIKELSQADLSEFLFVGSVPNNPLCGE
jgi:hypothetical protein